MATTHHIISYQIEIFDYRNTFLTLFLSRIYEMSTEFTLLIIPIFILLYSVGSFHSFHCFSYSYYRFGWIFFFFSRSDTPSCLSLQPSLTMLRVFFSWYISTPSLSSSIFGSKLSCCRFLIRGSFIHLLSPSYFNPDSSPEFPNTIPWVSPISILS